MLTRRSLLQAAAALVTGGAIAPALVTADPVATEYGRLGRARYIFPLELPEFMPQGWPGRPLAGNDPAEMDIRTLLQAHASIAVVQFDYDIYFRHHGRDSYWRWSKHFAYGKGFNLLSTDSLDVTFALRNEFVPPQDLLPSMVTVHGIVTKKDAPKALRLA